VRFGQPGAVAGAGPGPKAFLEAKNFQILILAMTPSRFFRVWKFFKARTGEILSGTIVKKSDSYLAPFSHYSASAFQVIGGERP